MTETLIRARDRLPDHLRCLGCGGIGESFVFEASVLVHCEPCDTFTSYPLTFAARQFKAWRARDGLIVSDYVQPIDDPIVEAGLS